MNSERSKNAVYLRAIDHKAVVLIFFIGISAPVHAFDWFGLNASDSVEIFEVVVVDPFIEMHTGPGRGYPTFNVVEQGETIEVLKRKPDWYLIRTHNNKTGWTKSSQLAHTLKPTGVPVDLPEISQGDYLKSHWRVGFNAGDFNGSSTLGLTAGYRPFSWTGLELEAGKVFDESITSDFYGVNLLIEPMADWLFSPYITGGAGRFSFNKRQKVVIDVDDNSNYISYGVGLSTYVGRNFVVRSEFRRYSISTNDNSVGLNAWKIGLSTFF